jgi:hypothetical protein
MKINNFDIQEGNDYDSTFTWGETLAETISVRARLIGGSGTGAQIGSVAGITADTETTISLTTSNLSVGEYQLEIWRDYGGASQEMLSPAPDEDIRITIQDVFGV